MNPAVKAAEEVLGVWIIKESPKNIKAEGWAAVRKCSSGK